MSNSTSRRAPRFFSASIRREKHSRESSRMTARAFGKSRVKPLRMTYGTSAWSSIVATCFSPKSPMAKSTPSARWRRSGSRSREPSFAVSSITWTSCQPVGSKICANLIDSICWKYEPIAPTATNATRPFHDQNGLDVTTAPTCFFTDIAPESARRLIARRTAYSPAPKRSLSSSTEGSLSPDFQRPLARSASSVSAIVSEMHFSMAFAFSLREQSQHGRSDKWTYASPSRRPMWTTRL